MAPPMWKLLLTFEDGSQFSSCLLDPESCPCRYCWCGKCGRKWLGVSAFRKLCSAETATSSNPPFWRLIIVFGEGSEFSSRLLESSVVGPCRYCWCGKRGVKRIQESDLYEFRKFFSSEAANSLEELLTKFPRPSNSTPISTVKTEVESNHLVQDQGSSISKSEPTEWKHQPDAFDIKPELKPPHRKPAAKRNAGTSAKTSKLKATSNWPRMKEKLLLSKRKQRTRTEYAETPSECDQCGKIFTRHHNLKIHYRTHTGERPYSCEKCAQTFIQLGHLQKHQLRNHCQLNS